MCAHRFPIPKQAITKLGQYSPASVGLRSYRERNSFDNVGFSIRIYTYILICYKYPHIHTCIYMQWLAGTWGYSCNLSLWGQEYRSEMRKSSRVTYQVLVAKYCGFMTSSSPAAMAWVSSMSVLFSRCFCLFVCFDLHTYFKLLNSLCLKIPITQ